MKILLSLLLIPSIIFANCNWGEIKKVENGYLYTEACNLKVGQMVKDAEFYKEEIVTLDKIRESHRKLLNIQQERIDLWKTQTFELEKQYFEAKNRMKLNTWIYFGLGLVGMAISVHLSSKLGDNNGSS